MKYNQSMASILAEMNEDAVAEGKMKQLQMMIKQKKSPEQIAKALKVDVKTIKSLMGEQDGEQQDPIDQARAKIDKIKKLAVLKKQMQDIQKSEDLDKKDEPTVKKVVKMLKKASDAHAGQAKQLQKDIQDETDLEEFTSSQIARLKKEYEPLRGKETGINPEKFKKLRGMMQRFPKANLLKLAKENIPVLSTGAKAALVMYHGMKYRQIPEDFVPYIEVFTEEVDEQKGKFKSVDPKVYARISKMMRGSKEEKQALP